ncbi:MAG: histidine phosphatase family protein [Bacteroidota bacterium]
MYKKVWVLVCVIFSLCNTYTFAQAKVDASLKVVILRHAEKPKKGDNLTCQGLNRAMQIPAVLVPKFGIPDYTYVPMMSHKESTNHARMMETVMPLAVKYNLTINSQYDKKDAEHVAADIKTKKGTVLMVWEHHALTDIVKALGVKEEYVWDDADYDSIWIVTYPNGIATLSKDKEGLHPSADCSY